MYFTHKKISVIYIIILVSTIYVYVQIDYPKVEQAVLNRLEYYNPEWLSKCKYIVNSNTITVDVNRSYYCK